MLVQSKVPWATWQRRNRENSGKPHRGSNPSAQIESLVSSPEIKRFKWKGSGGRVERLRLPGSSHRFRRAPSPIGFALPLLEVGADRTGYNCVPV